MYDTKSKQCVSFGFSTDSSGMQFKNWTPSIYTGQCALCNSFKDKMLTYTVVYICYCLYIYAHRKTRCLYFIDSIFIAFFLAIMTSGYHFIAVCTFVVVFLSDACVTYGIVFFASVRVHFVLIILD